MAKKERDGEERRHIVQDHYFPNIQREEKGNSEERLQSPWLLRGFMLTFDFLLLPMFSFSFDLTFFILTRIHLCALCLLFQNLEEESVGLLQHAASAMRRGDDSRIYQQHYLRHPYLLLWQ